MQHGRSHAVPTSAPGFTARSFVNPVKHELIVLVNEFESWRDGSLAAHDGEIGSVRSRERVDWVQVNRKESGHSTRNVS